MWFEMKIKKFLLFILLAPLGIGGCKSQHKRDARDKVVNLPVSIPVRSLNPRIANDSPSIHVMRMMYEGLMSLDSRGKTIFGVAKSVDISEDHLIYTFHLRECKWTNGDAVTAYDFEHAWKQCVDPRKANMGANIFHEIKNASACLEKKVGVDEVGVRALDGQTLEVELEHPVAHFLTLVTGTSFYPVNKRVDLEHPDWSYAFGREVVCNGPFRPTKWKNDFEICFAKNERYWNADVVKLDGIRVQIIPDLTTQYYLYEKGEIDWMGQPFSNLSANIVRDNGGLDECGNMDTLSIFWFVLNTEHPPFNNANIRRSFAYAINRKEITDNVFQFGEKPALRLFNGELALQEEPYFDDGNVEKAKECFEKGLKELGMEIEDLPQITLSLSGGGVSGTSSVAQAVQQQIYKALGVQMHLEHTDFSVLLTKLAKGDYMMGSIGWMGWLDPIYTLKLFRTRSLSTNMCRWENEQYKECLDKADYEIDLVKRREYLHRAEQLLMEEMPVIPFHFSTFVFLKNSKLKGVYVSPAKQIDFKYAYFED